MNRAIILVGALLATSSALAQSDVTETKVDGMTILVKRVPGDLATAQLYVRGGSRNWTKADAGVEAIAMRTAADGGTESLDKVALGRKLASLGATLWADTGRDWSVMQAKGPVKSFDPLFAILTDAFLKPALPASELEVQRERQLSQLRRQDEDPDGRLGVLVNQTIFKGHPYENPPEGTLEVVQKINRDQLVAALAKVREKSRLLLVVVGDVDNAKVVEAAKAAFKAVPKGKYAPKPLPQPKFAKAALTTEERKLPTNYIQGVFVGPKPGSKEHAAAIALNSMLRERMFEEVRTKRNLSYAPGVVFEMSEAGTFGGIYVTATDPNATLPVMIDELKRVQSTPLNEQDLVGSKAKTRTNMLTQTETTDGQATALARAHLLTGDWRNREKLLDMIAKVTAADLQAVAKKHFGKMQTVLLGDPKQLDAKLATSF